MDVIKKELEIDPLAIQYCDEVDTAEKKPISEEGNLLDFQVTGMKTECMDHSCDFTAEFRVDETALPTTFVSMKCKAEEELCDLDTVKNELKLEFTAEENEILTDRRLILKEAIAIIESDDTPNNVENIFIEPPAVHFDSDEDSGDEDGSGHVDNLTGCQLSSGAEIVLCNNERVGGVDCDLPSSLVLPPLNKKLKRQSKSNITWSKEDIIDRSNVFPEADYTFLHGKSPVDCFEMIVNDELINLLTEGSSNYALIKNCMDPKIAFEEMKIFLAILLLSGYNTVPSKRSYWEAGGDVRNELVVNAMRRDRFLEICRFVHCVDNSKLNKNDKLCKLRPLINHLKSRFVKLFQPEQCLDFDECMVEYYGRHSCKQFIRGEPIRFGYKIWCLNTSTGYLINFDVYQGENPNGNVEYEENFGKYAAPMVSMLDELPEKLKLLPFRIYFGNLFTGVKLLAHLKNRGYGATGTIRENRIPKDCPLTSSKEMKKRTRGSYEMVNISNEGIGIVRWVDNSVVTIASTCHGVQPISYVSRYSQAQKKKMRIPCPTLCDAYNKFMGGTDRMDENISYYRIGIRGKKWWWSIFTWMLDAAVHNSWLLMKKSGANISHLEFRRHIVQTYLQRYRNMPICTARPSVTRSSNQKCRISVDIRLDGAGHLVAASNRRHCAGRDCNSVVRTECTKCKIGLCIPCFVPFHTK
ncbi:piggyBac transposable element-derived protein 3-like isoform X2 [Periplaneta americana]|uniref:piggyBac transposable element-derived protein 3-like isoform X2 n=1 Tax=Periplaneta americana TaxID=6978 RepID=UPI0037E76F59